MGSIPNFGFFSRGECDWQCWKLLSDLKQPFLLLSPPKLSLPGPMSCGNGCCRATSRTEPKLEGRELVFRSLGYTLGRAPKRVLLALRAITADIHVLKSLPHPWAAGCVLSCKNYRSCQPPPLRMWSSSKRALASTYLGSWTGSWTRVQGARSRCSTTWEIGLRPWNQEPQRYLHRPRHRWSHQLDWMELATCQLHLSKFGVKGEHLDGYLGSFLWRGKYGDSVDLFDRLYYLILIYLCFIPPFGVILFVRLKKFEKRWIWFGSVSLKYLRPPTPTTRGKDIIFFLKIRESKKKNWFDLRIIMRGLNISP